MKTLTISRSLTTVTLLGCLGLTGGAIAFAGGPPPGQVCEDLSTGHIAPPNGTPSVVYTAPAGSVILGWCVKAGSAQQGLGPENHVADPPVTTITITHSSGKDISHYSVLLGNPPATTTTTTGGTPSTTTTAPTSSTTTSTPTSSTTTSPPVTTTTTATTTQPTTSTTTTTTSTTVPPSTTSTTTSPSSTTTTSTTATEPPSSTTTATSRTWTPSTTRTGSSSSSTVPSSDGPSASTSTPALRSKPPVALAFTGASIGQYVAAGLVALVLGAAALFAAFGNRPGKH